MARCQRETSPALPVLVRPCLSSRVLSALTAGLKSPPEIRKNTFSMSTQHFRELQHKHSFGGAARLVLFETVPMRSLPKRIQMIRRHRAAGRYPRQRPWYQSLPSAHSVYVLPACRLWTELSSPEPLRLARTRNTYQRQRIGIEPCLCTHTHTHKVNDVRTS